MYEYISVFLIIIIMLHDCIGCIGYTYSVLLLHSAFRKLNFTWWGTRVTRRERRASRTTCWRPPISTRYCSARHPVFAAASVVGSRVGFSRNTSTRVGFLARRRVLVRLLLCDLRQPKVGAFTYSGSLNTCHSIEFESPLLNRRINVTHVRRDVK